jgi:hypothetical protein
MTFTSWRKVFLHMAHTSLHIYYLFLSVLILYEIILAESDLRKELAQNKFDIQAGPLR